MTTRHRYDRKLAELFEELLQMGVRVEESLKTVKTYMTTWDKESYKSVRALEEEINGLEILLEDKFITLMATEHPVAHDLRKIVSSLKIIASLERMGDYAVHIAKSLKSLEEKRISPFRPSITKMLDTGTAMLDEALSAFIEDDTARATAVAKKDDLIDAEYKTLISRLYGKEGASQSAKEFASLLLLGRNLERIGDHVTNICEWIVYTGECRHIELND